MDVGGWLRGLGLGKYEAAFRDNGIDELVLPHLTVEDLKELGVASVGDRRKLLTAIGALVSPTPSEQAASPQPSPAPPKKASEVCAERRPITVLFFDLVGSTGLVAKLDPEDWRNLVNAYLDEASKAVTGFGGHVLKRLGDGLMALFGYPRAQENDAERAVRAALAIQRALGELNARNAARGAPELKARIGVECGSVVVDAAGEVFGEAPNVAARVQAAAEPGAVLVTASVQRQTAGLFVAEDIGAHQLKGVPAPMTLYRVVRASGGRRGGARILTPLVGREDELSQLQRRWLRALEGEGQFVQIVGEPGIGKSRLIEEFRAKLTDTPHTWVEWTASQLLQNTPLHPLAEWGRLRFGGADATDEGRLADLENTLGLIGLDAAEYAPLLAPLVDVPLREDRRAKFSPEELRRRQLAAMTAWVLAGARSQPVVLAFEDLHWADPTSLDLLRALAERGAQSPLLVVATTRPEFRAPWAMRSHHGVVSLAPLDRAQVRKMVGEIASRHALSDETIDGVGERTGGVPLFVEEVTRLLLERDAKGGAQAIPPTLQQSLAARLDRLGEVREVAQIGAVLGREFSYALLCAVAAPVGGANNRGLRPPPRSRAVPLPRSAGEDTSNGAASVLPRIAWEGDHPKGGGGGAAPGGSYNEPALQAALDRLTEADLLFVDGAPPTAVYRFKHALIQDAAYESLLKSSRQALHRRSAEALRDANAEPEAIAHHFTEAGLYDLAIEWWGKAGDQALRRSAFQEAIAHLGKAIAMTEALASGEKAGGKLKLHVAYGNAMILARGYGAPETAAAFERAREIAAGVEDDFEHLSAQYGLWAGSFVRGELGAMCDLSSAMLRACARRPQSGEASVAHRICGATHWYAGEFTTARDHLEQALAIFDPERDGDLAFRFGQDPGVAAMAYSALVLWALGEFELADQRMKELNARAAKSGHVPTSLYGLYHAALFELIRRNPDGAAPLAGSFVEMAKEHQTLFWVTYSIWFNGWRDWLLGARDAGRSGMRNSIARQAQEGTTHTTPFFETRLAEADAEAGETDVALATITDALAVSERTGQRWYDAETHRVRGEILLRRTPSDPALAEDAFLAAVAVAQAQKARSFGLRAALSLAKLYQSTGRPGDGYAVLAPNV